MSYMRKINPSCLMDLLGDLQFNDHFSKNLFGSYFQHRERMGCIDCYSDNDGNDVIEIDVPGLQKDDIDISFENGMLVITGERKKVSPEEKKQYSISERSYRRFQRKISINESVIVEKINAELNNGVLKIKIPYSRKEETQKKISIKD